MIYNEIILYKYAYLCVIITNKHQTFIKEKNIKLIAIEV